MKAIKYIKYGSPQVIKIVEIDMPQPKENQVLIKVHASSVSPAECAFRSADPFVIRFFGGLFAPKSIPGDMFSGEIVERGKNVTAFSVGDKVFGATGPSMGAHAQYVALDIDQAIVKMPENMSFAEGCSIADGAITALPFLRDHGSVHANHHILINGASGSIGTYAVQLAKYYGATVTAVCSGNNIDLVKSLGADYAIDYTKEDFTQMQSTYDIIFDAVGKSSFAKCKAALKPDGIYMTTIPNLSLLMQSMFSSKKTGKKAVFAATGLRKPGDKKADFEFLRKLADQGRLKTIIDKVYSMNAIVEAHEYVEKGHKVGNVVVQFLD